MRQLLTHRGPDAEGEKILDGAGLGHTRLSIIDLERGDQPLGNEDRSVWVVYNGEIYNHRSLRGQLVSRGHEFRTECDTEVLVHAYEEFGLQFVERLNGMFAFALYDSEKRRMLLVRDQLGIKPLFYMITAEGLFFASSIRALLVGAEQLAHIRFASLQEYLTFRYVAGRNSFVQGVHRLPAAHIGIWENGSFQLRRYWEVPEPERDDPRRLTDDMVQRLDDLLADSVQRQLMSDVPLGTYCSGGIDSGLVTAYGASRSEHGLKSFSVGFQEESWDESTLAAETAAHVGTEHHIVHASADGIAEQLPSLIELNDEPLSHPNSIPLFQLSRFARQFVKVVLTGEGADELFCGYPRYHVAQLSALMDWLPSDLRGSLGAIGGRLPGRRMRKAAEGLAAEPSELVLFNSAFVAPEAVEGLTGAAATEAYEERRRLLDEQRVDGDLIAWLSRYELVTYLQCALDRMDRMSMAVGLESRVPIIDVEVVDWVARLPSNMKIRGLETKRLLRRVASRHLTSNVRSAPKSGFGLPMADWLRSDAFSPLIDRLRDPTHPASDYFDGREVESVVTEHLGGAVDHHEQLWLLVNVYVWVERFLSDASAVSARPALRAK